MFEKKLGDEVVVWIRTSKQKTQTNTPPKKKTKQKNKNKTKTNKQKTKTYFRPEINPQRKVVQTALLF